MLGTTQSFDLNVHLQMEMNNSCQLAHVDLKGGCSQMKDTEKEKKKCREDLGGNVSSPEFQAQF